MGRLSVITRRNVYSSFGRLLLALFLEARLPLRLVMAFGALTAFGCLLTGVAYLLCKLVYWHSFDPGVPPLVIGLIFLGSLQLVSLGIIGEYSGAAHPRAQKERIGF